MDWKTKTWSIAYLSHAAWVWDRHVEAEYYKAGLSMITFLKWAGVIPLNVEWRRRNAIPQTSINGEAIPGGYLAEVAYEWDDDGVTTARQFTDMLKAEIAGTPENEVISETMQELGSA